MAITLAKSDTIDLTAFGEELAFFHLLGLGISENARLAKGGIDTCEVWCSHPVEKLKEYCNVVKIKMFWSLLFSRKSITFADEFSSLFMGWNVDAIWEFNVLEDLVDLIKKVVNIPHFISGVLRIGSGIENGFFHLEEAVDWIRCVGDSGMLHNLEQLADSGRVKVEVIFAE
ncbi:E3 ubiquitin-protein ligase TTC3-like, partial [Hirundo rustica]|uniref:E3 ubiquitin-protein ligase TTC3-like n=1 Tax=Hirundo rustica TaxID=43150 RepID=UPI001A94F0C9